MAPPQKDTHMSFEDTIKLSAHIVYENAEKELTRHLVRYTNASGTGEIDRFVEDYKTALAKGEAEVFLNSWKAYAFTPDEHDFVAINKMHIMYFGNTRQVI